MSYHVGNLRTTSGVLSSQARAQTASCVVFPSAWMLEDCNTYILIDHDYGDVLSVCKFFEGIFNGFD